MAFHERLQAIPPLAVDKNIDLTEAREHLAHHAVDICLFGQIDRASHRVDAESLDVGGDLLGIILGDICDCSFCAGTGQSQCHCSPDASTASRNQSDLSLKFHHATLASPAILVFSARSFSSRRNASSAAPNAPTISGSSLTLTFLLSVSSSALTMPFDAPRRRRK